MKELIAFILPPAVALGGMRLNRLLLGAEFEARFGGGISFALGLASGMVLFSQAVLFGVVAGFNAARALAILALLCGVIEVVLLLLKLKKNFRMPKVQIAHLWLLLLIPVAYSFWVFGKLSTLEGTLDFDANAFWVFKSKVFYLSQGKDFQKFMHQSNLTYAHWDYPLLVPCLYTLGYGAVGQVDEFVNKVWPFWMVVSLCLGILSLGNAWKRPHPLPIAAATLFCFLPATLKYMRWEGGGVPMASYASLAALLFVRAISQTDVLAFAAGILALAGCATTKFEGVVHAAVWSFVLLPICWRRGWWKHPAIPRVVIAVVVCLIPYALFRFTGPPPHPESGWWSSFVASPGTAAERLPQVWFLAIFARYFNGAFFHWTGENGDLSWSGHWSGLSSLANEELAVLAWLVLILLGLCLYRKANRMAVMSLTIAILATITIISFVISCLPRMQADLSHAIDFACNVVGRYYYPFFAAWLLGLVAMWFPAAEISNLSQKSASIAHRSSNASVRRPPKVGNQETRK